MNDKFDNYEDVSRKTPPPFYGYQTAVSETNSVMKRVYVKMFLALLVTAFVSLWGSSSYAYLSFMASHSAAMWILMLAEIGIVIYLSARLTKMSATAATLWFYIFAVLNGLMLAPIFLVYTMTSIAKTFFICAGTFGAMSVYGYFTKQDLTKVGSYLVYALIGLIIVSLVNLFTKSTTLEWIISGAGVLIFIGLTAWDTQTIKKMSENSPSEYAGHIATIGALNLYLDFINLFLYLLRFFGNKNN